MQLEVQPVWQTLSHADSQPADWHPSASQPYWHDDWQPSSHPEVHETSQQMVQPADSQPEVHWS